MAREQSPMANFHHETDDDDDDDDDTIELSVEERRLLRKVKRAAKPFKSLERTNQRKNGVQYERAVIIIIKLAASPLTPPPPPRPPRRSVGRDCCATVGRRHQ